MTDGFERMERLTPGDSDARPSSLRGASRLREGLSPLHPLSVGQLLDRALEVFTRCFLPCVVAAFLFLLPSQIIQLEALLRFELEVWYPIASGSVQWPSMLLVSAVVARASYAALQGQTLPLGTWAREVLARLPWLLVVMVLMILVIAGAALPAVMLIALGGPMGGLFGLFFLMPIVIYVFWRLVLGQVIVVLERTGPVQALGRSWRLTERGFWRWLGAMVLSSGLTLPLQLAGSSLTQSDAQAWLREMIPALGEGGLSVLTWLLSTAFLAVPAAFGSVLMTVLYVDQRVRREGFDLVMRLERLGQEAPEPTSSPAAEGGLA